MCERLSLEYLREQTSPAVGGTDHERAMLRWLAETHSGCEECRERAQEYFRVADYFPDLPPDVAWDAFTGHKALIHEFLNSPDDIPVEKRTLHFMRTATFLAYQAAREGRVSDIALFARFALKIARGRLADHTVNGQRLATGPQIRTSLEGSAWCWLATYYRLREQFGKARRCFRRGLAQVRMADYQRLPLDTYYEPLIVAEANFTYSILCMRLGLYHEGVTLCTKSAEIYLRLDLTTPAGIVESFLAYLRFLAFDDARGAIRISRRALNRIAGCDDLLVEATKSNLLMYKLALGLPIQLDRETPRPANPVINATAQWQVGRVHLQKVNLERAEMCFQLALSFAREHGKLTMAAEVLVDVARISVIKGRFSEANRTLQEVVSLMRGTNEVYFLFVANILERWLVRRATHSTLLDWVARNLRRAPSSTR